MSPQEPIHHTCQVQPWRLIPCPTQDLLHISQNQRSDTRLGCFSSGLAICPQPTKQIGVTGWQRAAVNKGHESGLPLIGFTEMFIMRNDRYLTYSGDSYHERTGNGRFAHGKKHISKVCNRRFTNVFCVTNETQILEFMRIWLEKVSVAYVLILFYLPYMRM